MEVDDIISYHDVVTAEKASLQKGMNFGVGKKYSIFLMSLRENAPYADALEAVTGQIYLVVLVAPLVGLHTVHSHISQSRDKD